MRISEKLRNLRLPAKAFHVPVKTFFLIFIISFPLIPLSPKVHRNKSPSSEILFLILQMHRPV